MVRKLLSILLAVILIFCFSGCSKDTTSGRVEESGEKLECSICGHMNSFENNFCSACGCGLKASIGNPEDFYNEDPGLFEDVSKHYSLLDYFRNTSDKPLIIYTAI